MYSMRNIVESERSSILNLNEDVSEATRYTKWLFRILGIWPIVSRDSVKIDRIYSYFLICLNFFSLASIIIPCGIYIIWFEKDINMKLILIGPVGYTIKCALKYFLFLFHTNRIRHCLKYVEICWSFVGSSEERRIMIRSTNFSGKLTIICAIFMYSGGISYIIIVPLITGMETDSSNKTIKSLVYPGYDLFVDSHVSPMYEILYVMIFFASLVSYTLVTAACHIAALLESHVLGVNQILTIRLKNLVKSDDKNEKHSLDERIALVVKCHVFIIKFVKEIERVLREICLIEVVLSTFIICLLEYYCMMEWANNETISLLRYIMLLISLSFNIFIFCYIGQLLHDECQSVKTTAYMTDWYEIREKRILALVMIIAIAERPCKITAGGMIDMTLESFGKIMKSTFVYLNLLRKITYK